MNQALALQLEEVEQMDAPLAWYWYVGGAIVGFGAGVGVGILLT